ncbi:MAG: hypothetical protein JO247_17880 [Chloroflexi bacterium]|nr:hypothetical protein [Chloroflexota bacterium]
MRWLISTGEFVYDFLADDGWELLVGLALILPLTYAIHAQLTWLSGVLMLALILLTLSISLGRKLPRRP